LCLSPCGVIAQPPLEPTGGPIEITILPDSPSSISRNFAKPRFDELRLEPPNIAEEDAPNYPSFTGLSVNGIDFFALQGVVRQEFTRYTRPSDTDPVNPVFTQNYARYNWGGLIAQSFFFNGVESAFRIADDDQIRRLMAKKPFWHDYFASMRQFNMGRWNDGDEFLVNYVGHPMQGAVSAYIEIQNSPKDRMLRISATHDYWMSRFRGFLWSLAFSTHSEISPLGEAGIGNEGGWTYPIAPCHRPCTMWHPPMHSTNNTGWVDFIITPTVGMLWVFAEDTLDRYVSDPIQGIDQRRIYPKIVRGALNPSRTFANAMRLKKPWYRDFQEADIDRRVRPGVHMLRGDEGPENARHYNRFLFGAHYRSMPFGSYGHSCFMCVAGRGGVEADYALAPWVSISFGLDSQQTASEKNSPQPATSTFTGLGIRLIHDRPQNTFSFAVRPGWLVEKWYSAEHFDIETQTYVKEQNLYAHHTAATLLLANDYKINHHFAFRSALGVTIVRYRTQVKDPPGIGKPPYLSWLSHDNYSNHTTWIWEGGPVFRF
jgi:hypothetical protein